MGFYAQTQRTLSCVSFHAKYIAKLVFVLMILVGHSSAGQLFAANLPPKAEPLEFTVQPGQLIDIELKCTDPDDNPPSDPRPPGCKVTEKPEKGWTYGIEPNIQYRAKPDATGKDSFTYIASDSLNSSSAVVTINIEDSESKSSKPEKPPVIIGNQPPSPKNIEVTVIKNQAKVIELFCDDVDSIPGCRVSVKPKVGSTHDDSRGMPYVIYKPGKDQLGNDSFVYEVSDSDFTETATVYITVVEDEGTISTNKQPVSKGGSSTTSVNTPVEIKMAGSDPDGDELTYIIVKEPSKGVLKNKTDNSVIYEPDTDAVGADSFEFKVSDGKLESTVAVYNITVTSTEVNQAPVAKSVNKTINMDETTSIRLEASDPDQDALTYEVVDHPLNGTVNNWEDGLASYVPNAGHTGVDSFTYRAFDGELNSNLASVNLNIVKKDEEENTPKVDLSKAKFLSQVGYSGSKQDLAVTNSHLFAVSDTRMFVFNGLEAADGDIKLINNSLTLGGIVKRVKISQSKKYLYVANMISGLQIIDISNPDKPVLLATLPINSIVNDVTTSKDENLAFIASEDTFVVVDISNKNQPRALSEILTTDGATFESVHISSSGKYAFVAAGQSGLYVFDIGNPEGPILLSSIDTDGFAKGVVSTRDESLVYVADGLNGVKVINVGNKQAPFEMSRIVIKQHPSNWDGPDSTTVQLFSNDKYLLVGTGTEGPVSLDVENPAKPIVLGNIDTRAFAYYSSITPDGSKLAIMDTYFGMYLYQLSQ